MKEEKVRFNGSGQTFTGGERNSTNNSASSKAIPSFSLGTPNCTRESKEGDEKEHRSLAKVKGRRSPEEVLRRLVNALIGIKKYPHSKCQDNPTD